MNGVMTSFQTCTFLLVIFHVIFIPALAGDNDLESLVDFGGKQKFYATTFDRDAIETKIDEHSTLSPILTSQNNQRAFNINSVLDSPQSEWMSTTTVPSHQPDDHPLESHQEPTSGEKPPVKDDDFVLVFSHAIEIPLARTPQSIIESNSNEASPSLRQGSVSSEDVRSSSISSSNRGQVHVGESTRSEEDINRRKAQLLREKKYQEVPVVFQTIPASSYEAPDPYVRGASPSQPLVRMYSYLAPVASASTKEQNQYEHFIPPSTYRAFEQSESGPVYERQRKYPVEQPRDEPNKMAEKPPTDHHPSGYSTGSQKFIPLSPPYRAPVLPFFPSMPQHQYGIPRQRLIPTLTQLSNLQSSQSVPSQRFPQQPLNQMLQESNMPQVAPIASPSSPIRSLSNIPFFPRLFQLHQLLGGRRWL